MLLPRSHDLTKLIIRRKHVRALHSSLQATLHAVWKRFWPLAARLAVRQIIHGCVICFKCKPVFSESRMADLLKNRVKVSRLFSHTVDYAGPMLLN